MCVTYASVIKRKENKRIKRNIIYSCATRSHMMGNTHRASTVSGTLLDFFLVALWFLWLQLAFVCVPGKKK